jgi:hypothetical protein
MTVTFAQHNDGTTAQRNNKTTFEDAVGFMTALLSIVPMLYKRSRSAPLGQFSGTKSTESNTE